MHPAAPSNIESFAKNSQKSFTINKNYPFKPEIINTTGAVNH
jgi:hypothetical protein